MGFFNGIGNFLSGTFGGKKDDEERKKRQVSVTRPTQTVQRQEPTSLSTSLTPNFMANNKPIEQPEQQRTTDLANLLQKDREKQQQQQRPELEQKPQGQVASERLRQLSNPTVIQNRFRPTQPTNLDPINRTEAGQAQIKRQAQANQQTMNKLESTLDRSDVNRFNQLDLTNQRRVTDMAETRRNKANPLTEEGRQEINKYNTFLETLDTEGKRKGGNPFTLVDDLAKGMRDDIGGSSLGRIKGSVNLIGDKMSGKSSGTIRTAQDLDNVNELYKTGAIDYKTLMRAFKDSPALYSANVDYGINQDGGIRKLNSTAERTGEFARDTIGAGLKVSEYMPVGFASGAKSLAGRFGSRALQGGTYNLGANLGSNLLNTATDKTSDEIAQEATASFALGGLMEGVAGRRLGTPLQKAVADAPVLNNLFATDSKLLESMIKDLPTVNKPPAASDVAKTARGLKNENSPIKLNETPNITEETPSARPSENSPIKTLEHSEPKPSGISSPNRPAGENAAKNFKQVEPPPVEPRPEFAEPAPKTDIAHAVDAPEEQLARQAEVERAIEAQRQAEAPRPLDDVEATLKEQELAPPPEKQPVVTERIETPEQQTIREMAESRQPVLTERQIADIQAKEALDNAQTEAMMQEALTPQPKATMSVEPTPALSKEITPPPVEPMPEPVVKPEPKVKVTSEPVTEPIPVDAEPFTTVNPKPKKTTSEWAKRVYSQTDLHKDMKQRLAAAVDKKEDSELEIGELLSDTNVSSKDKAAITKSYNTLETLSEEFNKFMQGNRKLFKADTPEAIRQGISQLDEATSRKANKLIDAYGRAERDLNGYIRKVQGQKSWAHRGVNVLQNVTGARNASLLSSVGGIERNATQELGANLFDAIMHPPKYIKGIPHLVPEVIRAYKRAFREYTVKPKTISEALPYTIGNTYRVLMAPVTGQANFRKSVMRETLAESLLRAEGLDPTKAEIKKFAGSMGPDSEVVANNLAGIMNGMTSHTNGLRVMKDYQEFIRTGDVAAKEAFMKNAERSSNLAAKLSRVGAESDDPKIRAAASLMNIVMPFVTTASNMAKTAGTYNFNPMARSVPDEVMRSIRSNPANALALLKANAVKGGVLASVYGLYAAGVVQYNNGDEVDKPRGISIDIGNGEFFPVRGTPIEVPIAAIVAAGELSNDVADGNLREWQYYGGILGNSLPYIDSTNNILAATASGLDAAFKGNADQGTGDNGYAFKSYGVNMAKSFVPYSNNGIEAGINAWQGKSTNAKSAYDKDTGKWLSNSVRQAYDPAFRATLKDSRDAAGRVRTVDQQGGFRIQKDINDELTKTYNDTIDDLVKYARQNKLGNGTQNMFNTYPDGKNNNFKSVQDKITFLDAPEKNGKKTPDNAKKLEPNEKLYDLSQQIYNGFFGDTSAELLTLNGEELRSDVAVPGKNNTGKNTNLPISIASIRNAIAQTDLPQEDWDKLNSISDAKSAIAERAKSGEIDWSQYYDALPEFSAQENAILTNSPGNQRLSQLMTKLRDTGFFEQNGFGSTRSGQTYLWNSLNAMLGDGGKTPAAEWAKSGSGNDFTPWGRRSGGKAVGHNFPTNLLKSASQDTGLGKQKMGERLFKAPQLVSTADNTKKSRIPTISVKKGIHL